MRRAARALQGFRRLPRLLAGHLPVAGVFLALTLHGTAPAAAADRAAPPSASAVPVAMPTSFAVPVAADDEVTIVFASGESGTLPLARHRGFPAVPVSSLSALGWDAAVDGDRVRVRHRTGIELVLVPATPWMTWDGELLQLTEAPYLFGDDLWVPLQLVGDVFPGMLPNAYEWDPEGRRLEVAGSPRAGDARTAPPPGPAREADRRGAAERDPPPPGDDRPGRVVIIDAGHGGEDTGAVGPGGSMEKDVALAISRALARELADRDDLEVHLTRDGDELVPIWSRGELATEWKDGRIGLFLSIHANALPGRPEVRGFETYFLSEARTEHERRVAAAENAPLLRDRPDPDEPPPEADPLLDAILRDLRTFDHQQWSSLLAEIVQEELGAFHPGPDRGVKQGPFAVITNALMPSVLVEVGFITNPDEERLLNQAAFHRDTARALARAVDRFLERYPSGSGR